MNFPFKIIEVFNDQALDFRGNTAAVTLLSSPLADEQMQSIAANLNQPATAFLSQSNKENTFDVRWFAPDAEIGLCGHGALAAIAFVSDKNLNSTMIELNYKTGKISGYKNQDGSCSIKLKAIPVTGEEEVSEVLQEGLGIAVKEHFATANKHIVVVENEMDLKNMKPDFARLRDSDIFGYSVTAPGNDVDFVSRTLVPHVQQLEDPATGSSHAALVPFWSKRLGKSILTAHQLSQRGGKFFCEINKDMVTLKGNYKTLAQGEILY